MMTKPWILAFCAMSAGYPMIPLGRASSVIGLSGVYDEAIKSLLYVEIAPIGEGLERNAHVQGHPPTTESDPGMLVEARQTEVQNFSSDFIGM